MKSLSHGVTTYGTVTPKSVVFPSLMPLLAFHVGSTCILGGVVKFQECSDSLLDICPGRKLLCALHR